MRAAAILVLVLALLVPAAQAHGGDGTGLGHLSVGFAQLKPNESRTYHLDPSSEAGPITLTEGWVFGVYALVDGASGARLTVELDHEGIATENWTWLPGPNRNTTRLAFSGTYEVTVHNPTNLTAGYYFYYDQSCNCKGKLIPLTNGWNLFNYDLPKGRDAFIGFPMARHYEVRGALATLKPDSEGQWPQDFNILQQSQAAGPGWLNFTFKTDATQRYFVYVEAIRGVNMTKNPPEPIYLTPLVEVKAAQSPAIAPIVVMVVLAASAVLPRRKTSA